MNETLRLPIVDFAPVVAGDAAGTAAAARQIHAASAGSTIPSNTGKKPGIRETRAGRNCGDRSTAIVFESHNCSA